jgi:hypothetical protein
MVATWISDKYFVYLARSTRFEEHARNGAVNHLLGFGSR